MGFYIYNNLFYYFQNRVVLGITIINNILLIIIIIQPILQTQPEYNSTNTNKQISVTSLILFTLLWYFLILNQRDLFVFHFEFYFAIVIIKK